MASKLSIESDSSVRVSTAAEDMTPHGRKDVGIQVKISTYISMQRKMASLETCTQTPNIDIDDTYEAAILRGRPMTTLEKLANKTKSNTLKFYFNNQDRTREEMSLCMRFHQLENKDVCFEGR